MMDVGSPYNRLMKSNDILRIQKRQNRLLEREHETSRLRNITLVGALTEAVDTLQFLLGSFMHMRGKNVDILSAFAEKQRLRGLGFLLMGVAIALLLVDSLLE